MGPYKPADRIEYGHDVEGNRYKVVFKNDKEVDRIPTGEKLVWFGNVPANLGIKKFKREARARGMGHDMIQTFKDNVWKSTDMKDVIAKTALKARPKKTTKKAAPKTKKPLEKKS